MLGDLRYFISQQPRKWSQGIPWAEFWYNSSYHSAIKCCPFKVVYGVDPHAIMRYDQVTTTNNIELDIMLQQRDSVLKELQEQLQISQDQMKKNVGVEKWNFRLGTWCTWSYALTSNSPWLAASMKSSAPNNLGPIKLFRRWERWHTNPIFPKQQPYIICSTCHSSRRL